MAAAIAIEAGELQELFLWKSGSADGEVLEHRRSEVEEELPDIAIFLLSFADVAGIDLAKAGMRLYSGTTTTLAEDSAHNRIAGKRRSATK